MSESHEPGGAMSVQEYLARAREQEAARPPMREWLRQMEDRPRRPELSGARMVRESRETDDARWDER